MVKSGTAIIPALQIIISILCPLDFMISTQLTIESGSDNSHSRGM